MNKDEYMKYPEYMKYLEYKIEFMGKISALFRKAEEDLDKKCRIDLLKTLEDYAKVNLSIYRNTNR